MGLAQSHAEFFQPSATNKHGNHGDNSTDASIDPLELLYRVERALWRSEPSWLQPRPRSQRTGRNIEAITAHNTAATSSGTRTKDIDPMGPMTASQALELVPSLMDEKWVAALVALSDSMDVVIQSTGLALLSRIVRSAAAEDVFVKVGGIAKLMTLLDVESANVRYLALEVIHALCSRDDRMVLEFNQRGLVQHLAKLAALGDVDVKNVETTLASLKILKLILPHQLIKAAVASCRLLPMLLSLAHSSNPSIASVAVVCIGLTLPDPTNMAEIVQLGCIEALLKLVTPSSAHSYAVVQALSVVADQDVSIFPKELTILTMAKTLDTLRGGAKRSKTASASAYLFASLAKSPVFRTGLCIEGNLSILSKLLVGGSSDVLRASVFALGVAAFQGSNATKEILFSVEAPQNLLKLLDAQQQQDNDDDDDDLTRLILFALSAILDEAIVLSSGRHVDPACVDSCSEPLRLKMRALCTSIVDVETRRNTVLFYTTEDARGGASTFAAKLLCCMCMADDIKRLLAQDSARVQQMLQFLDDADHSLLASLVLFFIECSTGDDALRICELVRQGDSRLDGFVGLFGKHDPLRLLGLLTAFTNFACHSMDLRSVLSAAPVIEHVLALSTKVTEPVAHLQALTFLDEITQRKNSVAIANIFAQSPDRVANFLHSTRGELVRPTLTVLRRIFKHHNNTEMPSTGARRQLVNMLSSEDLLHCAVPAARVWGNLLLHVDKRESFAVVPRAVETLLRLIQRCRSELVNPATRNATTIKNCRVVVRAIARGVSDCVAMKKETACAPSFLVLFELFGEQDDQIMHSAVEALIQIVQVPALRRYVVIPSVLETLAGLLRDRDPARVGPVYRIAWLAFVAALSKRDAPVQCLLAEYRVVDAVLLLVHSPASLLELNVLEACMEALAWLCSSDAGVRKQIASSSKLIDLALKYVDTSANDTLATACLHLLQRLSTIADGDEVKNKIRVSGGAPIVMRVIHSELELPTKSRKSERAFAVARNLVTDNNANKTEFQRLGFNPAVVAFIPSRAAQANLKLPIRGLQAITAMCTGANAVAKLSKQETLECEHSNELLQLVASRQEPKLCRVWCEAATSLAQGSPHNQRRLVEASVTRIAVAFIITKPKDNAVLSTPLQVSAARLLAYMASLPANRSDMMNDRVSDKLLLAAILLGLQSDVHDLQRYVALLVAHLATRNDDNKVRIGAAGVATALVDRLSSKQLNVVENVLQAVMKLGSHAGNKVKFGSRVCFEKLLALVHHDELAIRKGAVSAIAVLIEGNDANKSFLLQCEANVVAELCALMKSPNGKIVESAMLILGELSQLSDQTLEISKFIDIVVIVRMIEHVNVRIRRAALHTVLNLTKESFNKLRFGIQECVDAMLSCLKSEDMLIVELATTCLANLSFMAANALKITTKQDSLPILLKLAAASATSKDYLSWNEARSLGLGKDMKANSGTSPRNKSQSPPKKVAQLQPATGVEQDKPEEDTDREEEEVDDKLEPFVYSAMAVTTDDDDRQQVLDFSTFPARQTAVLEQALLVISNCADAYHSGKAVEKVAVKVICQALGHPSELVKRCACYILGVWCKKDATNQRITTKQGILPVLIQLLHSPNLNVVESAVYALAKLAYFGDNHMKLLQLDLLTTIVQNILRKPANASHEGLMDRTIRLLGTLVRFPRVRQTIKSEEIIADILTQLLQIHRTLAKNISRLILGMLEEESLKFFLPKKTVMILRVILTDGRATTLPKTVRNVLCIFQRIATVEEHKTTIALEDSGEALARMIQELCPTAPSPSEETKTMQLPDLPPNAATVLSLLACVASNRKIATILHDKNVYGVLPLYLTTVEESAPQSEPLSASESDEQQQQHQQQPKDLRRLYASPQMVLDALLVAQQLCTVLGDRAGTKLSHADFSRIIVDLLRVLAAPASDGSITLLPEASFECFCILDRLSAYSRDQQSFAEECAVEIVHFYSQQWIEAAERDGTVEGRQHSQDQPIGAIDLVAYVTPLTHVVLRMAEHDQNKSLLVQVGAIPLLLRCLHVALLTDELRVALARSLRRLCCLSIAFAWFDTQDVVTPLFRFMHMHRHHAELLLLCLGCLADVLENSVASRRHVMGQSQVLTFLLQCLDNAVDEHEDKLHFAINALECLSMEPELANAMAQLGDGRLHVVSKLLLLPVGSVARATQYFAIEMIGYMASYGYADRLGLQRETIASVLRFVDYERDEAVTGESIALVLWTLAHLVRKRAATASMEDSVMAVNATQWILETDGGVDNLVKAGLMPSEHLGTTASVTANTLTILLAVCMSGQSAQTAIQKLVSRNRKMCTSLAVHLEAVEREVNLPALRLLAICMAAISVDEYAAMQAPPAEEEGTSRELQHNQENWSAVFRHLMEWMEVYARDPARCPGPSLADAFVCLNHISSIDALAAEFRGCINRSGLAEIVGNAITFLDPTRPTSSSSSTDLKQLRDKEENDSQYEQRHQVLLNALKICGNLMEHTPAYCERFFLLNVPQSIENVLMADDDELITESLVCMNLLADWSSSRQLLFCSLRCVQRLAQLLGHHDTSILVKITPLLALMCSRIPSLPGLCTHDGIRALCDRLALVDDWRTRDRNVTRISEDCATMLLSLFSNEDSVSILYEQVDVAGKMFEIVKTHSNNGHDAPELPLRVLTKISSSPHSHARLLQLLPAMCQLLQGASQQLGGTSQHLVLCILFNLFCRSDDAESMGATLRAGEHALLSQLLPLSRWVGVPNTASVRITLKILQSYVSSSAYKPLLNDGKNIPALLKLVADPSDDVSGSATQLLLAAISEREVEIAVTVEDGIAVVVRTMQKTTKSHLQCLLLAVLRNMCHDSEIPVLIMNEDGVSRLVYFIRERKGIFFGADERLALSCKILRHVSAVATPGAATRIVEARGHVRLIELSTHQETSTTKDTERATTFEILANLAASGEVTTQLVDAKLHDHCLKWILAQPASQGDVDARESIPSSRKLALSCLRSLCKFSKPARDVAAAAAAKGSLVELLERWLQFSVPETDSSMRAVTDNALAMLMFLSKTQPGRHAIFAQSSSHFVTRVCDVLLADLLHTEKPTPSSSSSCSSVVGVKLLGNLLSDLTPERFRVTWACDSLTRLLTFLQGILTDHQQKKLQLHALNLLSGSYDGDFYFPVSTQMLSDLFNLLLISPTPRHAQQAEHVIIKAFEREQDIQQAIAGNQILEQLVIVFTQRVESQQQQQRPNGTAADTAAQTQRRPLAPALTHVLNVSMARGFVVHPRFTSKIVTLLCTSPLAVKAEAQRSNSTGGGDPAFSNASAWTSDGDEDEEALAQALAVYLGFVYHATPPSTLSTTKAPTLQQNIRDALRSEVNLPALATLVLHLLGIHDQLCVLRGSATNAQKPRELTHQDLLVWNLVVDCLHDGEKPLQDHVLSLVHDVPHELWLCLLKDMFTHVETLESLTSAMVSSSTSSSSSTNSDTSSAVVTSLEATAQTLRMVSVIARHSPPSATSLAFSGVIAARATLCTACLQSCLVSSDAIDPALRALASARVGWGDDVVVQSCQGFSAHQQLICQWLSVFSNSRPTSSSLASSPSPSREETRVLLLQLLLLLVSSGTWVDEFKSADIRGAIENNELIPATHKSLSITILGLLGYNADLNVEFQLALDRFEQNAELALSQRQESLTYLVHFLQLYTLTDEPLQERAIDCLMRHLAEDCSALARESSQSRLGTCSDEITRCIHDYLVCLTKLSQARKFADLYMQRWNTNALLSVCFHRRRAANTRAFRECAVLTHTQIHDTIQIVAKLCDACSPVSSAGTLSDTTFLNAMTLLEELPPEQTPLCERILAVLAWSLENEDTFDMVCRLSSRLRAMLRFVTALSDDGVQSMLAVLDVLTKRVAQIELLAELLTELLTCVYRNAAKLKNGVREKLLLYVLMILKRMGEDDLTACSIYEQSIQVILANVHVPAEIAARCSWDLLGVLTEMDAAVVTIFNFDGIQIMLKEFCGPSSAAPPASSSTATTSNPNTSPVRRVLSTRKSAMSAADRAALTASSAAASEVTYRRMEALKCLSKAVRNHDEVLQKIGETPGIGAHLFRVLSGGSGSLSSGGSGTTLSDHETSPVATSVAQEHAAHLIARVSSQEFFRASLLSQDHVSILIESLESVHPKIVLYALEALFYLSEFALCLDALVRHATVPVLAQILASPLLDECSDAIQQMTELFVLGLLANMCAKSKVIGRRVVSSNLLPKLRVFLAATSRPQIQLYAAWVVKSVSKDSELVAKLHEQRMASVLGENLLAYEPIRTQRKAFGALCYMVAGHRPGTAFVDSGTLRHLARVTVCAMHPLVVSSKPKAQRTLARGLTVLEAIAARSQVEKDMLCDEDDDVATQAIPLVLQLLDSVDGDVKLKALLVMTKWLENNTDRAKIRRVLLAEPPLLSLVRAISEEQGECLLVALLLLNTLLAIDEELKSKLSAMTNEVLLRLLPTLVPVAPSSASASERPSSSRNNLNPMQLRALNESLKSLVAMTRSGSPAARSSATNVVAAAATQTGTALSTAVENALEPLVELLRMSKASESLRLNALYLLVNFAGSSTELRPRMLTNGTMLACIRTLQEPHDDKLLQLCLLGMALLTGAGVDFTSVVGELLEVVDVLLHCLVSKNASVQANAVWVVSNICGDDRLKVAIASRGGATTLQSILNETTATSSSGAPSSRNSDATASPISSSGSSSSAGHARPPSSSQRIREYAPKAIRSLGFAPMAASPPPPPTPAPAPASAK